MIRAESTANRSPKILIIDDDALNVRLLESILKSHGYSLSKAFDGPEGLKKITSEPPDLVLLDVMMPGMSGFEVCQSIKARFETRLLPIIMVTALNAVEEKVQALDLGADDFLSKPIDKNELLAKVRSVLRTKFLHDEVEQTRQELEQTNRELVRLEEFKEKLMQMVVHDLKNPLTGIMGYLQLLQMQGAQGVPVRFRELVARAEETSRQLMGMILNILDVARLEERKLVPRRQCLRPQDLVGNCLREAQGLATREQVSLRPSVSDSLPGVQGDPDLLLRTLGNLVNNSLKHTPPGGTIEVGAIQQENSIRFWVTDDGEGIPPDLLPKIFDRFVVGSRESHTVARAYDTGLGLTFCKMAVEAHGGRIQAESLPGRGSTFSFLLPVAPGRETTSPINPIPETGEGS